MISTLRYRNQRRYLCSIRTTSSIFNLFKNPPTGVIEVLKDVFKIFGTQWMPLILAALAKFISLMGLGFILHDIFVECFVNLTLIYITYFLIISFIIRIFTEAMIYASANIYTGYILKANKNIGYGWTRKWNIWIYFILYFSAILAVGFLFVGIPILLESFTLAALGGIFCIRLSSYLPWSWYVQFQLL